MGVRRCGVTWAARSRLSTMQTATEIATSSTSSVCARYGRDGGGGSWVGESEGEAYGDDGLDMAVIDCWSGL